MLKTPTQMQVLIWEINNNSQSILLCSGFICVITFLLVIQGDLVFFPFLGVFLLSITAEP